APAAVASRSRASSLPEGGGLGEPGAPTGGSSRSSRRISDPALAPRRSYTTSKRSPARLTAAVVAVVAVLVIAVVLILSKAGGSSSTASSAHSTAARKASAATHAHRAHARRSAPGGSRAAASTA